MRHIGRGQAAHIGEALEKLQIAHYVQKYDSVILSAISNDPKMRIDSQFLR